MGSVVVVRIGGSTIVEPGGGRLGSEALSPGRWHGPSRPFGRYADARRPQAVLIPFHSLVRRGTAVLHPWPVPSDPTSSILNARARQVLRPMGLQRKGRSRTWLDDHGWWLTVIEFQPSGFGRASYLNVGICWLWSAQPTKYLSFDLGYRVPGAGASFESEEQWHAVVDHLVHQAADEVTRYRELVPDLAAAAHECVRHEEARVADLRRGDGTRDVPADWPTWHAAVACGLASDIDRAVHYFAHAATAGRGDRARAELWRPVRERATAWSELVTRDHDAFVEQVRHHTADQRRALKLSETWTGPTG